MALLVAGTLAAAPVVNPPPAQANLPVGSGIKNAQALLRNALPIDDAKGGPAIREIQRSLEAVSEALRIPGKKSLGPVAKDVKRASTVLDKKAGDIAASFAPDKKEAGLAAIEGLKSALVDFRKVVEADDKQAVPDAERAALSYVSTIEESMMKGMAFDVPTEYQNGPLLLGRAELEMDIKLKAVASNGVTGGTFRIVLDGYNAPVSAGNFADLVLRKFYDGVPIQRADGFVVQFGNPSGTKAEGFVPEGSEEVRRIPFEYRIATDKAPVYSLTCEDLARCNDAPALPFNAFGTLAVARAEFEVDSGSSQMFFLLKESELTPTGSNLLDGRYAVFGYITEGADLLNDMRVNDQITGVRVVSGGENLKNSVL